MEAPPAKTFDLQAVQAALREFGCDGWLLYDFRGSNLLARHVLGIGAGAVITRRFFYYVPAHGEPAKLVHRIEDGVLDSLPGEKTVYVRWQELETALHRLLEGADCVAMEYSPRNANPYVARVDAGTVELVRECNVEVVSSGDLIQLFEATWDERQRELHRRAAAQTNAAFDDAWAFIAGRVRSGAALDETDVLRTIVNCLSDGGLVFDHPPIVAVGPNSGNPHYETGTGSRTTIGQGDFVLIDLWGKLDEPGGVYSDLTRVAYAGESVPETYGNIFRIVAEARDAAIEFLREAFAQGRSIRGWEVDQAAREVIESAGYGEAFVHRTGHNIGEELHGSGAHMDNLETHEDRRVLKQTCFSIEPGIYLPEFGVRSEVDVYVDASGTVHVTGGDPQTEILPLLRAY